MDIAEIRGPARLISRLSSPLDDQALINKVRHRVTGIIKDASARVIEECGFGPAAAPKALVIGRSEWATRNVDPMLRLMSPMLNRIRSETFGPLTLLSVFRGPALGVEMGVILQILSTRVLGQYDVIMGQGEVMFVAPNIVAIEQRLGFNPSDFRMWVALHEVTHTAQFEGVPWLREHFLKIVDEFLGTLQMDAKALLRRLTASLKENQSLAFLSPDQREGFASLQAFMSVIEGHANFIMDKTAEGLIESAPRMRAVLRGGVATTPVAKILGKLLGLDIKKAQYEKGQKFFDEVANAGGASAITSVFDGSEMLPTLKEIEEPSLWLARARS